MAKKKKRKEEGTQKFAYSNELWGIVFIVCAILGIGLNAPLGFVGRITRAFAVFLVGSWDIVLLAILLLVGGYMLIKRERPLLFSSRAIGLYLLIIGVLVYSHLKYIDVNNGDYLKIFEESINEMMMIFDNIMSDTSFITSGGGVVGCAFALMFTALFASTGTKLVAIIFMIFGGCIFTGISIIDIIKRILSKSKAVIKHEKNRTHNDGTSTDDFDKKTPVIINDNNTSDNKMVISSIEELAHLNDKKESEIEIQSSDIKPLPVSDTIEENKINYKLPNINILKINDKKKMVNNQNTIEKNIVTLEKTLHDFGINGKVVEVNSGPTVTQYEMELQTGTKLSRLLSINKEISLALAKKDVRIQAPIPGKSTVGVEIPNDATAMVGMREVLENIPAKKINNKLLVVLGKDIMGNCIFAEIDKTPHLLVAGATGSGKSVCINCIIASLLMRTKPDEVKLILIDPKKVELSMYNGIPHLLMPVVNDPKKASIALQKVVSEMESRYDLFSEKNVKNIATYNEWVEKENLHRSDDNKIKKMNYIVVIVDELADLMLVASKEVEDSILRITQMARAAGIHLIVATQRPSTDVITGIIKANIPSRISFAVSSSIDSRTILDMTGAEKLLGKGDMLFLPMGENSPQRIQGAFVSDEELQRLVDHTVAQQKAQYDERYTNLNMAQEQGNAGGQVQVQNEEYDDPLYNDIVEFVITTGKASASLLQRRFKLGYNRAARIVDLLEERGIIGPQNGSKPRDVLVKLEEENNNE